MFTLIVKTVRDMSVLPQISMHALLLISILAINIIHGFCSMISQNIFLMFTNFKSSLFKVKFIPNDL